MNKKTLLTILLILLGLSAVYSYLYTPRQKRIQTAENEVRDIPSGNRAISAENGLRVHLDLLTPSDEPFQSAKKDIFGPLVYYVPPPPRPQSPVRVAPPPPPPQPKVVAPTKPLPRFTLLGSIEKAGKLKVFLALGSDVFVVGEGSRFGKSSEYSVTGLTKNLLTLHMAGDDRPITIPLVDKNAGKPMGIKRKVSTPSRPEPASQPEVMEQAPATEPAQETAPPEPANSGSVPYLKMPE